MTLALKFRWLTCIGIALFTLSVMGPALAQKIPLRSSVELTAFGGVQFKAPKWIVTGPKKPEVAVLRNDKMKGAGTPLLLMLSVEKGPSELPDWNVIRQNIVNAARANDASLKLSLKEDYTNLQGVTGKRMAGSLLEKEEILSVELIALYKDGRLATVTLVRTPSDQQGQDLVGDIAASAVFNAKP